MQPRLSASRLSLPHRLVLCMPHTGGHHEAMGAARTMVGGALSLVVVVAWAQTTRPPSAAKSKLERLRIAVTPWGGTPT